MKVSFFSMTEAKHAAGDKVKNTMFNNVETAQVCTAGCSRAWLYR